VEGSDHDLTSGRVPVLARREAGGGGAGLREAKISRSIFEKRKCYNNREMNYKPKILSSEKRRA
jgi:hypothetical protein